MGAPDFAYEDLTGDLANDAETLLWAALCDLGWPSDAAQAAAESAVAQTLAAVAALAGAEVGA